MHPPFRCRAQVPRKLYTSFVLGILFSNLPVIKYFQFGVKNKHTFESTFIEKFVGFTRGHHQCCTNPNVNNRFAICTCVGCWKTNDRIKVRLYASFNSFIFLYLLCLKTEIIVIFPITSQGLSFLHFFCGYFLYFS